MKVMESLLQKFAFHHVMLNMQRYSPSMKHQWGVKIPLEHLERDPSSINAVYTNTKHGTAQTSCLFKWAALEITEKQVAILQRQGREATG